MTSTTTYTREQLQEFATQASEMAALFADGGGVVELRALDVQQGGTKTLAGYFDEKAILVDPMTNTLAREAMSITDRAMGVYITMNPVNPALLARCANRVSVAKAGSQTVDSDIVARRWMMVDVDPVRLSGISATDEEKAAARDLVDDVSAFLDDRGWPIPLLVDSGNGFHLYYRIDLPTDDGGLVKSCLGALGSRFDTSSAKIDPKVHNPSRIVRLAGTLARKGDSIPDRPHRRARILCRPDKFAVVPRDLLDALAAEAEAQKPKTPEARLPDSYRPQGDIGAIEQARRYVSKMDSAISGQDGSGTAFRVACKLTQRFALTVDEALPLMREYSERCAPPWSEAEILHKLEDASKKVDARGRGYGLTYSRNAQQSQSADTQSLDAEQDGAGTGEPGKTADIPFNSEWCGRLALDIKPMSEVERENVAPLWPYRFYLGKLSIVAGHPGYGKSYFTHWLASRVSVGGQVPFHDTKFPLGDVLLLASEDGPGDTIRPRLEACGADLTRIHVVEGVSEQTAEGKRIERMVRLDRDIAGLRQTLLKRRDEGRPVVLIVVDVLDSYLGKTDAWKSTEVRAVLGPFAAMAAEFNACVIGVSHLNKAGGGPAVTRAAGSMAFVGLARSAWLVCMDPEDALAPTGTSNRRLLIQTKNNLAPAQRSLGFAITDDGLIFTDESDVTADAALSRPDKRDEKKDRGGTLDACCDWLRARLADGSEHPSDAVKDEAKDAGHSFSTFRRAKEELGVVSRKGAGGKWFICLHSEDAQLDASPEHLGHVEHLEHVEHLGPIDDQFITHRI